LVSLRSTSHLRLWTNSRSGTKNGGWSQFLLKTKDEVAVSAGATCHCDNVEISHVLKAMNIPIEWARGTLSFST
jgi:cysteine sulfinate desulfinase/cysteine desulfurase-like protein